jgi:hypothetical protein
MDYTIGKVECGGLGRMLSCGDRAIELIDYFLDFDDNWQKAGFLTG